MKDERMKFYAPEKIGPKQSMTPEGFLLCEDVPIARTGEMIYAHNETPIAPGDDGLIHIFRDEEEVFNPKTLASFAGKPVTNNHPESDVTPENWRFLSVGVVLHPRRGEGEYHDCMVADLLITEPNAIEEVRSGKREVSNGYEADYAEAEDKDGNVIPGRGFQKNIIGNHVALVESGRCGPRCAIGDRAVNPQQENQQMSFRQKVKDLLRRASKVKDEKELEKLEEEVKDLSPEEELHLHVDPSTPPEAESGLAEVIARLDSLESQHAEILAAIDELKGRNAAVDELSEEAKRKKKEEEESKQADEAAVKSEGGEEAVKAKDSAPLADSFQEAVAGAEIIVPGYRVPTYDKAATPKQTLDAISALRRNVLDLAYNQGDLRSAIQDQLGGKELNLKRLTLDQERSLFRAVVSFKKQINNNLRSTGGARTADDKKPKAPSTLAELNKLHQDFHSARH